MAVLRMTTCETVWNHYDFTVDEAYLTEMEDWLKTVHSVSLPVELDDNIIKLVWLKYWGDLKQDYGIDEDTAEILYNYLSEDAWAADYEIYNSDVSWTEESVLAD